MTRQVLPQHQINKHQQAHMPLQIQQRLKVCVYVRQKALLEGVQERVKNTNNLDKLLVIKFNYR
jgi:hypothetical protein